MLPSAMDISSSLVVIHIFETFNFKSFSHTPIFKYERSLQHIAAHCECSLLRYAIVGLQIG